MRLADLGLAATEPPPPYGATEQAVRLLWLADCSLYFFQAEDGIRDYKVTGVQTCALPISICVSISPCSRAWRCSRSPRACCGASSATLARRATRSTLPGRSHRTCCHRPGRRLDRKSVV